MPISFSSPANRDTRARGAGVTAVLGPTNTGKTHLAIERMLAHSSGIIGLPLRLLAREVYNKMVDRAGAEAVALVTGEEKIKPPSPRYWVSTVEAMPRDLDVAFLAIDEVQLAADLERGHVFTDRMLNRRGREETLVLGAQTVRPMVERLLPGAHILTRPRLSQLSFAGEKKITRLPRRSAVVAFSTEEVYAIAELIRRQRGGAAVVLGALSPRTRNAQVALYQSGDVDYLVATDAIGMGLNLDVDHVAFASDRKFDGYQFRRLNAAELAQIAGRAGRATRDGTFGTTGRCPPFETELVQALESHSFEPIRMLQWRNAALDCSSLGALQASLAATPTENGLTRAPIGEDIQVLEHAARDDEVRALATRPAAVERLWEVCQVPDYRKISPATHAELVITLYGYLMREGAIPTDWFSHQVALADKTEGDIDTLSNRIAHIRTWTFAANRPDWLGDPEHWQDVTRAVEDKLSDALHERLAERFVDRRTSVLMRRLRENTVLETDIGKGGEVVVEGHVLGRLDGFLFAPDASAAGSEAKALAAAAQKALAGEIEARAARLSQAGDEQFVLSSDGAVRWQGQAVAKLVPGEEVLKPRLRIIADERLTGAPRDNVQARLDLWLETYVERLLGPLVQLAAAEDVIGLARGIAFQLVEALGVLERQKVAEQLKSVDQPARATLRKYGVRFGAYHVYLPLLLKPAPRALALQLWALKQERPEAAGVEAVQRLAASGRTSIAAEKDVAKALYRVAGYRVCGERAVRVDILERLADLIRPALAWREGAPGSKPPGALDGRGFTVTVSMTSLAGCAGEDFSSILRSLGYRLERRPKPAALPEPTPAALDAASEAAPAVPAMVESDATAPSSTPLAAAPVAKESPVPVTGSEAASEDAPSIRAEVIETAFSQTAPADDAGQDREGVLAAAEQHPERATILPQSGEALVSGQWAPEQKTSEQQPAAEGQTAAPQTAEQEAGVPELIEVWHAGRPPGQRRHEGPPRGGRRHRAPATREAPAQPASASAAPAVEVETAGISAAQESHRRPRHRRPQRADRQEGSPEGRPPDQDRAEQERRRQERRGERKEERGRDRRRDRERPDPALRAKYIKGRGERRGEQAPDPDSPFAKLAALKAQLEASTKDGR